MFDLAEALSYVVRRDGSDLHLKVPSRPLAPIHGQLLPLEYYDPMRPEDTERVLGEMLAGTLRGVVSQRLVRTKEGSGRVAVCEILRMTGRAKDMIVDPDQTGRRREVIAEGEYYGMQTFDQALLRHYQAGLVSMEDAFAAASSPHDFKLLVAGDGRTSTSMDDIASDDHSGLRPVDIPAGPESDDSFEAEPPPNERPHDHEPGEPVRDLDAAPVRGVEQRVSPPHRWASLCFSS